MQRGLDMRSHHAWLSLVSPLGGTAVVRNLQISGKESRQEEIWSKLIGPEVQVESEEKGEAKEGEDTTTGDSSEDKAGEISVSLRVVTDVTAPKKNLDTLLVLFSSHMIVVMLHMFV